MLFLEWMIDPWKKTREPTFERQSFKKKKKKTYTNASWQIMVQLGECTLDRWNKMRAFLQVSSALCSPEEGKNKLSNKRTPVSLEEGQSCYGLALQGLAQGAF